MLEQKLPLVEAFYSLQGEGAYNGYPAFFIRLAGCKVGCPFCDSKNTWNESVWPKVPTEEIIAQAVACSSERVVITGGEPLIHNLDSLTLALRAKGKILHLETSGSEPFSGVWDWVCISPKKQASVLDLNWVEANELKVVISSEEDFVLAEDYSRILKKNLNNVDPKKQVELFLQCEWGATYEMQSKIIEYIKAHPQWRLSVQVHKYLDIQ